MNPQIPLEIFIPPSDFKHIHWIAGKDYNGLNAGVFLLRVNTWSLDLLTRTMTYKHYHPSEDYPFEEQTIFARLTEKDDQFKKNSVYVPKHWFNAYFSSLNEVKPGLLMSHFPHPDYKWHIYEWLRVLEADKDETYEPVYSIPVEETDYMDEIKRFWQVKRRTEKALKGFDRNINRGADPVKFGLEHEETRKLAEDFREKLERLRDANIFRTDDPNQLDRMITEAEEVSTRFCFSLLLNLVMRCEKGEQKKANETTSPMPSLFPNLWPILRHTRIHPRSQVSKLSAATIQGPTNYSSRLAVSRAHLKPIHTTIFNLYS